MPKAVRVGLASMVVAMLLGAVPSAVAKGARSADVQRSGACRGSSTWNLELSNDNGRIEADLEVHTGVPGQTWRIRMKDNGAPFWHGRRTTQSDGSFEVDKYTTNLSGPDTIAARSVNVMTGEVCRAKATIS